MGKREPKWQDGDKDDHVRWEMSMRIPNSQGHSVEQHGDGRMVIKYVPMEECPPAQRMAWERLWQILLTPRPVIEATGQDGAIEAQDADHDDK